MKKIYLAIPYSGNEEKSYILATKITAILIADNNLNVFSPITHSHPLTKVKGVEVPGDWEYWKEVDYSFIDWSDEVYIVIPNGDFTQVLTSSGVVAEAKYAVTTDKPISFISLEGSKVNLFKRIN